MNLQKALMAALTLALLAPLTLAAMDRESDRAELSELIRANYTKNEYRVTMRDGARLYTVVYSPNRSFAQRFEPGPYPILMIRTPYSCGPYGADQYADVLGPTPDFPREGAIFVCQDVRGRFMSEGEFVNMRPHIESKTGPSDIDESTDTYDTIEWLVSSIPNNNGRVGTWGNSYPGFYVAAGMIDSHPALAAAMPSAPIADWFWDDMHHHGAFTLVLSFNFFSGFGVARPEPTTEWPERFDHGTPDGYQFFLDLGPLSNVEERHFNQEIAFWSEMAAHPNYDSFWQSRSILPHLKSIRCAVLTTGGLFDAEDLYGPLHIYQAVEKANPGITNILVMGPWRHGSWLYAPGSSLGDADFGFPTAEAYRRDILLPFFRHYLKPDRLEPGRLNPERSTGAGKGGKGRAGIDLPEAYVFETGANRWRQLDQWPPKEMRSAALYLDAGGRLAFEPPEPQEGDPGFDDYISDPAKPVPYTQTITARWHAEYMIEDQRFAARRPDVLVYRSEPLEEDLTLAGPLRARLWVSTTGGDADWVVKLVDELPPRLPDHAPDPTPWDDSDNVKDLGGTQRLVRIEAFRGRFRESYENPKPFEPGEVTEVSFELQDVLHTFKRGHRIMIQVQSSLFPFIDRNPQSWVESIFEAKAEDFIKAEHRVYRTGEHASAIEVTVLE